MRKFRYLSWNDKVFYACVTLLLTLILIAVLYPCIFVLSASISSGKAITAGKVVLWPVDISFTGYETVFNTATVWIGFRNSLFYTGVGTLLGVAMTMTAGYCMSRRDVPGRDVFMFILTFTMFFSGGMIPSYLLIRSLKLLNTIWAFILPGALGAYGVIVVRTFIQSSIPGELLEASLMDGCSDIKYYTKIVLPLSKAVMAVQTLNFAVGYWNTYMRAILYLNDRNKYPLTIYLREILLASNIDPSTVPDPELAMQLADLAAVIKYALIIVTMIPILIIYPFIQKHFVKGVMIGSVKG